MANTSRINGFRPVKNLAGGTNTGQVNLYYVASAADEILVGDIVKTATSADAYGKKGASMASEMREKKAERMFRMKYPVTILGYFLI